MGAASRRKGLGGEREVADVFEAAGHQVRGFESGGDWLCVDPRRASAPLLHLEVKRAERLKLPEWVRQAEGEAAAGMVPVVVYRQNREPWRVVVRLDDLIRLLK
jgi:Holliday junction resolvase